MKKYKLNMMDLYSTSNEIIPFTVLVVNDFVVVCLETIAVVFILPINVKVIKYMTEWKPKTSIYD